jgi:thiamine pyrophosphate-dependent acetolactate synthase large subunit-like protein
MKRFECLKILSSMIDPKTIVVSDIGPISREWNALRPSEANLLQVNLGLCAAVGLGISVSLRHRQVVILDGDGNLLLNLASLADMANQNLGNTVHIVLDNEAYEGGGGLRSATAGKADLSAIARGAGVPQTGIVTTLEDFESKVRQSLSGAGHHFIVAKVEKGSVAKLPTLTLDGKEAKYRFARYIESTEGVQILRPRYTHI